MTTTDTPATPTADAPAELITCTIDGIEVAVAKGTLVIRAAEVVGVDIPRFCDHPLLEPVGACRQCLVEVVDAGNGRPMPKPQASCTIEVMAGMKVQTHLTSPVAEKAQHGTMEFLLINHPLDCPVCDKGGECPLQNQAMSHGRGESRFVGTKRTFAKPYPVSEQVLLDRERCVLCARCTRFSEQIAGDPFIALLERGAQQQVGIGEGEPFHSYFSGNTIQICPVGALTSADYRFRARPFDLVSSVSIAEHDACGAEIRVDHRRGAVMRRLAGNDPEVNEEWITDKDRFCFTWSSQDDRLRTPLVRGENGELEPASWPAALAIAARGLQAAGDCAVLPGGRLTAEDAYAYSVFARRVLGTNDIDFRSRAHSDEEAQFLTSVIAGRAGLTYSDLDRARGVLLVALEPEDEAGTIFLRLRKAHRHHGTRVWTLASHASKGTHKLGATLVQTVPGRETAALDDFEPADGSPVDVILIGERLAGSPGGFNAALRAAERLGATLAWVPRRAGERAALDTGCLPTVLPGGRPVDDAEARADIAAAWGVESLPTRPGRHSAAIIDDLVSGALGGVVVGGVELDDMPDPAAACHALTNARFVVSLEVRHSEVTRVADVVFPVAPPVEKAGSFISWDGRLRWFDRVLDVPGSVPDVRVLAGIAEEMGSTLGFRTVDESYDDVTSLGLWDGARTEQPRDDAPDAPPIDAGSRVVLSTWRQLIDDSRGQDGQPEYLRTARPAVLRASAATLATAGIAPGAAAEISTEAGRIVLRTELDDLPDGVVWAPGNSGSNLRSVLRAGHGDLVDLAPAGGAA